MDNINKSEKTTSSGKASPDNGAIQSAKENDIEN